MYQPELASVQVRSKKAQSSQTTGAVSFLSVCSDLGGSEEQVFTGVGFRVTAPTVGAE